MEFEHSLTWPRTLAVLMPGYNDRLLGTEDRGEPGRSPDFAAVEASSETGVRAHLPVQTHVEGRTGLGGHLGMSLWCNHCLQGAGPGHLDLARP